MTKWEAAMHSFVPSVLKDHAAAGAHADTAAVLEFLVAGEAVRFAVDPEAVQALELEPSAASRTA
jgi:hypothetical protein